MNEDIPRFVAFFSDKIKSGAIKHFTKTFARTKSHIELLPDERKEAKAEKTKLAAKKKPDQSIDDLQKMILAKRENAFGGFLNYMEDKYGEGGKKRKAKEVIGAQESPAKRKKK